MNEPNWIEEFENYHFGNGLRERNIKESFIGDNVFIPHKDFFRIGNNCRIDWGTVITAKATIGDYVHIAPYVTIIGGLYGEIEMKHFSNIACGGRIITASDGIKGDGLVGVTIPEEFKDKIDKGKHGKVILEEFVTIGTNAIVTQGCKIGRGAVIGANSYMNKDAEEWTIYVGSPARPIATRHKNKILEFAKRMGYEI